MIRLVAIQFTTAGKLYDFDAGTLELNHGDRVVVETERGSGLATVIIPPRTVAKETITTPLSQVKRLLGPEDECTLTLHASREKEAFELCCAKIKERGLEMKLVRVEYIFDGSKAIFYFTADGRVDFRELVKDLAHAFHTRIEMRQIGVRDEAKMVGGLGICGRELCCASFLRDFRPVSVKMAKEQNLALNPNKISGQCGRLLCCLDYEYETYCNLRKSLPKPGKFVHTAETNGTIEKVNLLTGELVLRQEDGKQVTVKTADLVDESNARKLVVTKPTELLAEDIKPEAARVRRQHPKSERIKKQTKADLPNQPQKDIAATPEDIKTEEKARRKKRGRRTSHRKSSDNKTAKPKPTE
ncbi:MAG: stage 0 sporulation family protein [Desulfomicrobium sp.]|nr:stage 0 sporulation family protein [Desulfomicrobium sp.]